MRRWGGHAHAIPVGRAAIVHYHFTDKREILLELIVYLETWAAERVQRRPGGPS